MRPRRAAGYPSVDGMSSGVQHTKFTLHGHSAQVDRYRQSTASDHGACALRCRSKRATVLVFFVGVDCRDGRCSAVSRCPGAFIDSHSEEGYPYPRYRRGTRAPWVVFISAVSDRAASAPPSVCLIEAMLIYNAVFPARIGRHMSQTHLLATGVLTPVLR